jgi:1,2-diacylglycerol 3-alpha-glucosyltransferase
VNICMLTNTFTPHVGGVARAVSETAAELRRCGHAVVVVCPVFPGAPEAEPDVVRIPALQRFNGSDFSVALPVSTGLRRRLSSFRPDIIHSHHPFLLGDTALRLAAEFRCPLVFTHHTLYEHYLHYVAVDNAVMRQFVVSLAIGYGNQAAQVIAPSPSVADLLRSRGLVAPLEIIPTGVAPTLTRGLAWRGRLRWGVPTDAFLVGHVGRLAPEKNLLFLAESVGRFLESYPSAYFLVVGDGPSREELEVRLRSSSAWERIRFAGVQQGYDLADIYAAMDVFAFTSLTETQGLVLTEAMMNGAYVVALDASGARDVIAPDKSGTLIQPGDAPAFAAALGDLVERLGAGRDDLRALVRASAARYSIEQTTAKLSAIYRNLTAAPKDSFSYDVDRWSSFLRRVEAEWGIATNVVGSLVDSQQRGTGPESRAGALVTPLERGSRTQTRSLPRGLILVQIDGLSRCEFERGCALGRLPFLRSLIAREHHRLHSHYSGLPSTTPAVQGELFYGVRGCVPAFEYLDRKRHQLVRMFSAAAAQRVEERLSLAGRALLKGGTSYSNIYAGGGQEAHYCAATFRLENIARIESPGRLLVRSVWYAVTAARFGVLIVCELMLALGDFIRGVRERFPWRHEAIFIPTRVLVSIVLRELITLGGRIDVDRGVRVIHLNYLGYDEQAHRRGPDSSFAHWALKGIDRSIERLARAGERSSKCRYQLWVYSDHGQERTVPYEIFAGRPIEQTVAAIFGEKVAAPPHFVSETIELWRSAKRREGGVLSIEAGQTPPIVVSAMGPLGHIYLAQPLTGAMQRRRCDELVSEGKVPLVLARIEGEIWAFHSKVAGPFRAVAESFLMRGHPFADEVVEDLERLVNHPDAGEIVIIGWRNDGEPLSFVLEWGAHGGPGAYETHGFALIPSGRAVGARKLRPQDLREMVEDYFAFGEGAHKDGPAKDHNLAFVNGSSTPAVQRLQRVEFPSTAFGDSAGSWRVDEPASSGQLEGGYQPMSRWSSRGRVMQTLRGALRATRREYSRLVAVLRARYGRCVQERR